MKSIFPPKRVLITFEDTRAAQRVSRELMAHGFISEASDNLSACIRAAGIFLPDVILLDVDNHIKSSCAAALRLRKMAGSKLLHLVAFTSMPDSGALAHMAAAGFDELLPRRSGPGRIVLSCL